MIPQIILWIALFIAAYLVIYFSADVLMDNLRDLSRILKVSPFLVGLLVLGIDPEESIASIVGAINGLPFIAVGNVIGNSIISISLCFALPALFYKFQFEKVPNKYSILLLIGTISIFISIALPEFLAVFGLLNTILFCFYLFGNLKQYQKSKKMDIVIWEENEQNKEGINPDHQKKQEIDIKDSIKSSEYQNYDTELKEGSACLKRYNYILKAIVSFAFVIIGGELLIYASEKIIELTVIEETFVGFLIIAFMTNVEEITLMIKAIQKEQLNIGLGGMIGKLIWNIGFTYGVSSIIAIRMIFIPVALYNVIILLCIGFYFFYLIKKTEISRLNGIILVTVFFLYIALNIALF